MREMGVNVAGDWAAMMARQPDGYLAHFHPFAFDAHTLRAILGTRKRDIYTAVYHGMNMVAFWMLRGWDAGYTMPTQGVFIDHKYTGMGLGRFIVDAIQVAARLREVRRIMTKVHVDNAAAYKISVAGGFYPVRIENGHHIMYRDL